MIMGLEKYGSPWRSDDPIQTLFELDLDIHRFCRQAHCLFQNYAPIIIRYHLIHLGRCTSDLFDELEGFIDREFRR